MSVVLLPFSPFSSVAYRFLALCFATDCRCLLLHGSIVVVIIMKCRELLGDRRSCMCSTCEPRRTYLATLGPPSWIPTSRASPPSHHIDLFCRPRYVQCWHACIYISVRSKILPEEKRGDGSLASLSIYHSPPSMLSHICG